MVCLSLVISVVRICKWKLKKWRISSQIVRPSRGFSNWVCLKSESREVSLMHGSISSPSSQERWRLWPGAFCCFFLPAEKGQPIKARINDSIVCVCQSAFEGSVIPNRNHLSVFELATSLFDIGSDASPCREIQLPWSPPPPLNVWGLRASLPGLQATDISYWSYSTIFTSFMSGNHRPLRSEFIPPMWLAQIQIKYQLLALHLTFTLSYCLLKN